MADLCMAGLQRSLIVPSVLLGLVAASLYGLLAVPLVLTYWVSRTIGFVQGGITMFSMFLYWRLIGAPTSVDPVASSYDQWTAVAIAVMVGALLGAAYGWTVTGRLADWPRVRLTIYSLGWMLTLGAVVIMVFMTQRAGFRASLGAPLRLPSVFGHGRVRLAGVNFTAQQAMTVVILAVMMLALTAVLVGTRTGTFIRAIADDPQAGRWVGIPLNRVGVGVYALAGGLSALAGVFITATLGLSFELVILVFLRALTVSILGGFMSLPLALTGCLVVGVGEALFESDGSFDPAHREMLVMGTLLAVVFVINRYRPLGVASAAGSGDTVETARS